MCHFSTKITCIPYNFTLHGRDLQTQLRHVVSVERVLKDGNTTGNNRKEGQCFRVICVFCVLTSCYSIPLRTPGSSYLEKMRIMRPEALQQHQAALGPPQGQGHQGGQVRDHLPDQVR